MQYRTLGNTGLNVSIVGFGASPLGNVFGPVTPAEANAAVAHALDSGINLFDVSPYYGLTVAEERLGAALAGRRHQAILATKCGRYGAADFDFSARTMTDRFEDSLRRLQTDHVDLLQLHDVEFGNIAQIVHVAIPAVRKLQQQGKARFIGITGYWPGLLARIAAEVEVDTVLNYCHSNLLADDMDRELAPLAAQRRFGLMNASPLHMGLLGGGEVPEWHPAPLPVREAARQVVALCHQHDINPVTLAFSTCLKHPAAASTFIGIRDVAQVDTALAAVDYTPSPSLLTEIQAITAPIFNQHWPSGRPANQPS